jgi:adenosylhomocysteine nucleosidase
MSSDSTIAILVALPVEARSLTSQKLAVGQTVSLTDNLILHISGMGAHRARAGAMHALGIGADALVSWGTAAGLDRFAPPGRLVLPNQIIDQEQRIFTVDSLWRDQLQTSMGFSVGISQGASLQVDQMMTSVADKRQLFSRYGATAIDMESAAIASVARQEGARFIAVRSIVDTAETAIPHWLLKSLTAAGEIRHWALAGRLCARPFGVRDLIQLARAFAVAKSALHIAARFIHQALPTLQPLSVAEQSELSRQPESV